MSPCLHINGGILGGINGETRGELINRGGKLVPACLIIGELIVNAVFIDNSIPNGVKLVD
jgi:hypothetical protein